MGFESTYREELAFLREMGREVALAQPGLCDTLAEPGRDPDVERLLEGFAFVAARTKERADDAVPELIASIAEVVAPHALRPLPASTVMELRPRGALVNGPVTIPRGAAFGSRPVDGVRCELRSTADVELGPLVVERAYLDRGRASSARLVIALRVPRQALWAAHRPAPLRFFVHAPLAAASLVALAIDRHLRAVTVACGPHETGLGPEAARLSDPDREPHLPWPSASPEGPRHLLELAYFPERHLFFDVRGLERVPEPARTERLELRLDFAPGTPLPETLADDALRLHCVPAVNAFPCDAEPTAWRDDLRDVPLRAAGLPPSAVEVLEVRGVTGLAEHGRGRRPYAPFSHFDHLGTAARSGYFALRRARSVLDGCVDTFLRVGARGTAANETLSAELTCTNRALATRLRTGEVCEPLAGSPASASFTNLLPLGPRASAPTGAEVTYALVGASRSGHRGRTSASTIMERLRTHAVPLASDAGRARACLALADAVREVRERPFRSARRGMIERGVEVEIELDEAKVPSLGEAFLLARSLDRVLASERPPNVQQRLAIVLAPSGTTIALPPRSGVEPG